MADVKMNSKAKPSIKAKAGLKPVLDARPDTLDFRDRMYEATLVEVPTRIDLEEYRAWEVPILDQGSEGACTGFGLATVANYLLRRRRITRDDIPVSPRMLYGMARRYDEWPGEDYSGSSARGAMKGWHKHGVCAEEEWPYDVSRSDSRLTSERVADASRRPLGAYNRVNHRDLVCMHTAMSEVGILYATGIVHEGWTQPRSDGIIERKGSTLGGHAFAVVAYDERGFWIQNSWGDGWGLGGFGLITYDDWLANASDVWVARLGAPVILTTAAAAAATMSAGTGRRVTYVQADVRPHIISTGNNGRLRANGTYGTSEAEVQSLFEKDFQRITENWSRKRILLYAHGGLTDEDAAVQRVADYRASLLEREVYPVSFIWKTDFWTTLTNILQDALSRRRPEGFLDAAKDFMLDRLDGALEPLARALSGKAQWDEMKENARLATVSAQGGARLAAQHLAQLAKDPKVEIHIVGHSAGSIFHAPLVQLLTAKGAIADGPMKGKTGYGLKIASCTLWAPACTIALFKETYLPALQSRGIGRFALFTLTDESEQDDHCANVYHKSLLYLVSHAFEAQPRVPFFREGEPLLGLERDVLVDKQLKQLFDSARADWVRAPNTAAANSAIHSTARHHGDFDDDAPTLQATLARILEQEGTTEDFTFRRSASSLRERRRQLTAQAPTRMYN